VCTVHDAIADQRRRKWILRIAHYSVFLNCFVSPRTLLPLFIAEQAKRIPSGSSREGHIFWCLWRTYAWKKKGSARPVDRLSPTLGPDGCPKSRRRPPQCSISRSDCRHHQPTSGRCQVSNNAQGGGRGGKAEGKPSGRRGLTAGEGVGGRWFLVSTEAIRLGERAVRVVDNPCRGLDQPAQNHDGHQLSRSLCYHSIMSDPSSRRWCNMTKSMSPARQQ